MIRQNVPKFHVYGVYGKLSKSGWGLVGNLTRQLGRVLQDLSIHFSILDSKYMYFINIHMYWIYVNVNMPCLSKTFPKRYLPSKIFLKIYHLQVFELHKSPIPFWCLLSAGLAKQSMLRQWWSRCSRLRGSTGHGHRLPVGFEWCEVFSVEANFGECWITSPHVTMYIIYFKIIYIYILLYT